MNARKERSRRRARSGAELTELNITPMLDMMTILLVFLLKSFATSSENVNLANLVLPRSTTKLPIEEALTLQITEEAILVDQQVVVSLAEGQVKLEDLPEGPTGYLIRPLYERLSERAEYFKRIETFGGSQFVGRIAVVADRTISYKLLFRVMYTAGRAEFGLFKLFVDRS
jgi:biopolymer transport protein ExbD